MRVQAHRPRPQPRRRMMKAQHQTVSELRATTTSRPQTDPAGNAVMTTMTLMTTMPILKPPRHPVVAACPVWVVTATTDARPTMQPTLPMVATHHQPCVTAAGRIRLRRGRTCIGYHVPLLPRLWKYARTTARPTRLSRFGLLRLGKSGVACRYTKVLFCSLWGLAMLQAQSTQKSSSHLTFCYSQIKLRKTSPSFSWCCRVGWCANGYREKTTTTTMHWSASTPVVPALFLSLVCVLNHNRYVDALGNVLKGHVSRQHAKVGTKVANKSRRAAKAPGARFTPTCLCRLVI